MNWDFKLIRYKSLMPALVALALTVLMAPSVAVPSPDYSSWFKYDEHVKKDWQFQPVGEGRLKIAIHSRNARAFGPRKRVMVLYAKPSSAYNIAITKILDVFAQKNISTELMVINFKNDNVLGKEALRIAEKGKFDLILTMGSKSTAWLFAHYQSRKIPAVSVCSKDPVLLDQTPRYNSGSGINFAFTSLNMPIEVQMAYVLELKPKLKNIGVLVDRKNISAMQTQAEPLAKYARNRGIRVLNVAVENPSNARQELAKLVPKAVAAMRKNDPLLNNSVFWITGSTSVFREIATINKHADRVPVLSVVPDVVKAGDESAVLSIGISFESNAYLAAIYAADVLSGRTRAGNLKVGIVSPPDIAINFRKAQEIGLRIPFSFFESASFVYDYEGLRVRNKGKSVPRIMWPPPSQ